jgi:hypothetical protein
MISLSCDSIPRTSQRNSSVLVDAPCHCGLTFKTLSRSLRRLTGPFRTSSNVLMMLSRLLLIRICRRPTQLVLPITISYHFRITDTHFCVKFKKFVVVFLARYEFELQSLSNWLPLLSCGRQHGGTLSKAFKCSLVSTFVLLRTYFVY